MKNHDEILDLAEQLTDAIKDAAPCGCSAIDGYVQALHETIQFIDQFPLATETKNGEDAVLADREELIRGIQQRLLQVQPEPELPLETPDNDELPAEVAGIKSMLEQMLGAEVHILKL